MRTQIIANAERGENRVALLSVTDLSLGFRNPPIFLVVLYVRERGKKPQHWSRTELEPDVARELYDQAVAEFAGPESEPSFHGEFVE